MNRLAGLLEAERTRSARCPSALVAVKAAGYSHVNIDGVLVESDRYGARTDTRRGFLVVGQA